jgi:hypothetical protein
MGNRARAILKERHGDMNGNLARGETFRENAIVVNVPCGVRKHAHSKALGDSVQALVFEQGRDRYDRNFLNRIMGVLLEAASRKFVFNSLGGGPVGWVGET